MPEKGHLEKLTHLHTLLTISARRHPEQPQPGELVGLTSPSRRDEDRFQVSKISEGVTPTLLSKRLLLRSNSCQIKQWGGEKGGMQERVMGSEGGLLKDEPLLQPPKSSTSARARDGFYWYLS